MSVKYSPHVSEPTVRFDRPFVLVLEGADDQSFATTQIEMCGRPDDWQVHRMGGKDQSWKSFVTTISQDRVFLEHGQAIGVVQDADLDVPAAIKRMQGYFDSGLFPVPVGAGDVAQTGRVRTGLFAFPDGVATGELEDLLIQVIPEARRLDLAREYISTISGELGQPIKLTKSILQAYLAGHTDFAQWVYDGLRKPAVLPATSPVFDPFRLFIRRMQGETV